MKQSYSTILLVIATLMRFNVCAQSLERQVIGSNGVFQAATWGSLSSTTGETITNTFSSGTIELTQGFQQATQSDLQVPGMSTENTDILVFPNPAESQITVVINSACTDKYTLAIVNSLGQNVNVPVITESVTGNNLMFVCDLKTLADAIYLIVVTDEIQGVTRSFKVTKIK